MKLTPTQESNIVKRYLKDGLSLYELAEAYKTTRYTIRQTLKKAGVYKESVKQAERPAQTKPRAATTIAAGLDKSLYMKYQSITLKPQYHQSPGE